MVQGVPKDFRGLSVALRNFQEVSRDFQECSRRFKGALEVFKGFQAQGITEGFQVHSMGVSMVFWAVSRESQNVSGAFQGVTRCLWEFPLNSRSVS